ncbi:unnamed protein product [Lepeophtheirus salmonis]|uniref:(salmon louse) hypothetical protein n=1 Tax=Lepeophtheirus salmonis TaxID=72036 RepID=A0A7R8D0C3_LEPSM|nr:unnamed protein product [Lepeophtheirus salmonis]CAF2942297.1 unnamed protein product [Lepeophtheirus salmonis]
MFDRERKKYDSEESVELGTAVSQNQNATWIPRHESEWRKNLIPKVQTRSRNILLQSAGVLGNNKEDLEDMWKIDVLPLIRVAMSRDCFKMMLRVTRFDETIDAERAQNDKAAPIRDLWLLFGVLILRHTNHNNVSPLKNNYLPF